MKRILCFLGIFASSILAFGVGDNNEATVEITAEFLAPLKIEVVRDADFGTLVAQNYTTGSSALNTKTPGELKITGEGFVVLKWADSSTGNSPVQVDESPLSVTLKNSKDQNKTLTALFRVGESPEIKNDANFYLIKERTLTVPGVLTNVASTTAPGVYNGSITFRVEYADDPMSK